MPTWTLTLTLLPGTYAICRLAPDAPEPAWARLSAAGDDFRSVTQTAAELSVVCPQSAVPDDVTAERGWRCLRLEGPFDLTSAIGVLAAVAGPLAEAGVGIFAVSTYDTDYVLVHQPNLDRAVAALRAAGHTIRP